jgi:hypothetical protein
MRVLSSIGIIVYKNLEEYIILWLQNVVKAKLNIYYVSLPVIFFLWV